MRASIESRADFQSVLLAQPSAPRAATPPARRAIPERPLDRFEPALHRSVQQRMTGLARPTSVARRSVATPDVGRRIAAFAGKFIGTPYDTDPLGLYVRTRRIVADEAIDCMYLVFRATELARAKTPAGAIDQALDLRFHTRGRLDAEGLVANYDDRFQYGEDMVQSGKWGDDVTTKLGPTTSIPGTRHTERIDILTKSTLRSAAFAAKVRDGDILYFVQDPARRRGDAIVGHLGIVHLRGGVPHVIHASGTKAHDGQPGGGVVKEVPLADYAASMRFAGALVTRFPD